MAAKPTTFNPDTLAPPPPTYNHVCTLPLVSTSKIITLSGQVGIEHGTHRLSPNFVDQVRQSFVNLENALKAAGASPRDIMHVRHYVVQDSGDAELNKKEIIQRGWAAEWMKFMDEKADGHRPPDTVIGVAGLAGKTLLYEVECWAVVAQ